MCGGREHMINFCIFLAILHSLKKIIMKSSFLKDQQKPGYDEGAGEGERGDLENELQLSEGPAEALSRLSPLS